jgi:SAM-dependent methyltransferase
MDAQLEANRALWDELVGVHVAATGAYDVDTFKAGRSTLRPLELAEVGDVRGKRLLHLQCHFGLDTLSWGRRGAQVVGADFSTEAIALARRLAEEIDVPAEFICSNVLELPQYLEGEFDVVFTSYGVLCWLPDLDAWAAVIAHFLAPGGFFYIAETHPVANIFDLRDGDLVASESYFDIGPVEDTSDGSYADRTAILQNKTSYEWQHPLSEVLNALIGAGLRIEFVHEFPYLMFQMLPSMVRGGDGWWRLPGHENIPLLFSLKARGR